MVTTEEFTPFMLSGGSDDGYDMGMDNDFDMNGGFDDGYDMNLGEFMDMGDSSIIVSDMNDDGESTTDISNESDAAGAVSEEVVYTNEIVVLQTANGIFLRFPLREIPKKKKGAIGVKGIKLKPNDYVTNVYVMDAGDNEVITYKDKQIELRSLKTGKRGSVGTKKS
jgi:DNA gyrase subunit A